MTAKPARPIVALVFVACCTVSLPAAHAAEVQPPDGFAALFNGEDLAGWYAANFHQVKMSPAQFDQLPQEERIKQLQTWWADAIKHWTVENGELVNDGNGAYLTTDREYGDIELLLEYKTVAKADSGIYLRGTPQVQIWDTTEAGGKWDRDADKGSGGLFNNQKDAPGQLPLVHADKAFGEWNSFRIVQVGERTSVWLNGQLVVDHAPMDNYWQRDKPLPRTGPIQLQTHGGEIRWRNLFIRDIPANEANEILASHNADGYKSVFNGKDFTGWEGPTGEYAVENGALYTQPGKGGTIYTAEEYGNFKVRLEFRLPPGGNNGLAIRYPGAGNPAYQGMTELQVLDTHHPRYGGSLDPRQAHGSAYGMAAAETGYLRPTGEWNFQEVTVDGPRITLELNGTVILDTDVSQITEYMADSEHPGKDLSSGHFGFAGHSDPVRFRNVRIAPLPDTATEAPAQDAANE